MVERNQKEQMKSDAERAGTPAVAVQRRVRRRLLEQIGSMVENAYRRGFQHGVNSKADDDAALKFRYCCRTNKEAEYNTFHQASTPPWNNSPSKIKSGHTVLERLEAETPREFEELWELMLESSNDSSSPTAGGGSGGAERKP